MSSISKLKKQYAGKEDTDADKKKKELEVGDEDGKSKVDLIQKKKVLTAQEEIIEKKRDLKKQKK